MRRSTRNRRRGLRAVALVVAGVLLTTACAGSVGKYRNATTARALTGETQPGDLSAGGLEQAAGLEVPGAENGTGGIQAGGTEPGEAAPGGGGAPAAGPRVPEGKGSTVGVSKDSIKIGLFYPQTGSYTALARNAPPATRAAFDEAGKIHGRTLELLTYDDGTSNASTIQANEKRAKDESFVILSVVSESNVVLAPLADQHRLPALLGNIDEKVALPLRYAFALPTYWARQAKILPSFIRKELKGASKRIGVVFEGTSTAKAAKDQFKAKAKQEGLNVVYEQPIAQNQSTCANEVSNLQAHRVELVYMMTGPLGAICMLRDARAVAYRPTWTGVGLSWSFNIVASASGGTADGIKTINSFTTLDTPAGQHYLKVMREHDVPSDVNDDIIMLAYGLVQTLVTALRRTGPNLTREAFVNTMENNMKGYDSGYYPPHHFGPNDRSGGNAVAVSQCCTDGQWTTPNPAWRTGF
jgi:ABC-type branched-subunit amino acid transport system substrate-binding protein